ncbi:sensor histidine kinase [Streptosporangium subroseum]|uniref:sensor histidine kinase n=1 Tax=Streptosporangium subroseum TaxID=106412 RepID=UPI00342F2D21
MDDSLSLRRWSDNRLIMFDALAAVGYTIVVLSFAGTRSATDVPSWGHLLIVAGTGLPLAVRRLWPLPVLGVVSAMSLLSVSLGVVYDGFAAAAFALYLVALTRSHRRREPTVVVGVLSAAAVLMLSLAGTPRPSPHVFGVLLGGVAVLGGAWTAGRVVRERRAHSARWAGQLTGRAVTEERLRIARELHDVVAHSMSLIAVKAGIANHVAAARPEEARDALRVIETTSRDALTEMRQLLGVLRSDSGAPPDLSPSPGLAGLPGLAGQAAMAGVHVELDIRAADLPEGVELSVYRIVQEALTNVVRHAAPARCRVTVEDTRGTVRIEVTDDGPGGRVLPGRPGHGLIGMRERVAVYGGTFTAGRRPEGGFGVSACLPYGKPA